jgi:uncharacterized protein YlzI (FlbEa/FlbD family)
MTGALAAVVILQLIQAHTVDGHEVLINPDHITHMYAAGEHKEANKLFVEGVHCVLNILDGKRVTTKETCDEIRELIRKARQP